MRFLHFDRNDRPYLGLVVIMAAVAGLLFLRSVPEETRAREYETADPRDALLGDELTLIFIGSSTCGASRIPGFPEVVVAMKDSLRLRAEHAGKRFTSVGVAVDWSIDEGMSFLQKFGTFDEVIIGRRWTNTGATLYLWRDLPAEAAVPQVVLISRHIDKTPRGLAIGQDVLVARKIGVAEIARWSDHGFPL